MNRIKHKLCWGFIIILTFFSNCRASSDDFGIKGFHLDLRIQVLKPEKLKELADELAIFGFNTLIMEWEATFPFEGHPLIPNRYAYTKTEIDEFITHCEDLGIDVIPLQQSFGHVEYILRHDRYAELREDQKNVSQVCPLNTGLNRALFTDLFSEMVSLHPGPYFHIGGDETYLLGHCEECSRKVEREGKSKLYVDHIKMLCEIVRGLGKRPILWADIALKYPEALSQLPEETIFIDWNYGWPPDHFGDVNALARSGFEIWGAPSLRSSPDNYFITMWDKHFRNFRDFIPAAKELGYRGMILTSWSTSGRYSPVYDYGWEIIDLIPIRRVYPLTGFRISIAAYVAALSADDEFIPESFRYRYCKSRFGFSKEQTRKFWNALITTPYQVDNGRVTDKKSLTIGMIRDSTQKAVEGLHDLKPEQNEKEFEHFRLMMAIRENYLRFKTLEGMANSPELSSENLRYIRENLESVIEQESVLSLRFIELNADTFHMSELEAENENRLRPAVLLYERLAKIR